MEACAQLDDAWIEKCSCRCGGHRGTHGLRESVGPLEAFRQGMLDTSCGALTLGHLLNGRAYLGARHVSLRIEALHMLTYLVIS